MLCPGASVERSSSDGQRLLLRAAHRWEGQIHLFQNVDHRSGDRETREPLVIGWSDIRQRVRGARLANRVFIFPSEYSH